MHNDFLNMLKRKYCLSFIFLVLLNSKKILRRTAVVKVVFSNNVHKCNPITLKYIKTCKRRIYRKWLVYQISEDPRPLSTQITVFKYFRSCFLMNQNQELNFWGFFRKLLTFIKPIKYLFTYTFTKILGWCSFALKYVS